MISLAWLGRCFGVLPRVRGIRTTGAYALVRHPMYASFIVMDTGLVLNSLSPWNLALLLTGVGLFALRIASEEHAFKNVEAYQSYSKLVRWRLCPGLF